jgi:alkylation response protein AidB-like acyl-CoA dehydrogenase
MARDPETKQDQRFVVEMDWEGVAVEHRCHFMGLRAWPTPSISFGREGAGREPDRREGEGLKIALTT